MMYESGEMYLENLLILCQKQNIVRAIDLADAMKLSKPSVSRALSKLRTEDYILVDDDGALLFTDKGRSVAEKIFERHRVLTQVLIALGVDEETAAADACKMEHDISDKTFEALKAHLR
ncbi:MAG: metal-dependent transcriptional regulator [Firmicutes bacterium]|nr:metal-dependent transcriptional regulator [Bacillota bacterium]